MRGRVLLLFLAVAALVVLPVGESFAATTAPSGPWHVSRATYYGPGLYGNGMACGGTLTPETRGVAHRTLPCGTMVEFEWQGNHVVVPVVDRGPYGNAAEWDLTEATCRDLSVNTTNRCSTGDIAWRT